VCHVPCRAAESTAVSHSQKLAHLRTTKRPSLQEGVSDGDHVIPSEIRSATARARLSELRYRGGATSYLEVLINETNAFNAKLDLAQAQLNELVSLVEIYRNLGEAGRRK
jgi:hypothetical protein